MIKNNWHTHTFRCGHATGSDEEYVLAAINSGVKKLGFSDHAAYPGVVQKGLRMQFKDVSGYIKSIKELKEKYQDKIEIYLGMEIEYYESFIDTLYEYRKMFDYLILGQHGFSIRDEDSYFIEDENGLQKYCDLIEKACEKGLVDCIAHPDVCLWSYPIIDQHVTDTAKRIAKIASKYKVALEINCGSGVARGKRKYGNEERYAYPNKEFFDEFAKEENDIIIGLDIHNPINFYTDEYINKAMSVVQGCGCNIIDDYDMIATANKRKKEFGYTN